jgi:hypothetical protein
MNDGLARVALVLDHVDPFLLDNLSLTQRLTVEAQLNAAAAAVVPFEVLERWGSGDPLMLELPDTSTLELVPNGANWTQANLHAYLEQEIAELGPAYSVAPAIRAECRICPPPLGHDDRTASQVYLNGSAWTLSAVAGPWTFAARVYLEIQVVFPQDG